MGANNKRKKKSGKKRSIIKAIKSFIVRFPKPKLDLLNCLAQAVKMRKICLKKLTKKKREKKYNATVLGRLIYMLFNNSKVRVRPKFRFIQLKSVVSFCCSTFFRSNSNGFNRFGKPNYEGEQWMKKNFTNQANKWCYSWLKQFNFYRSFIFFSLLSRTLVFFHEIWSYRSLQAIIQLELNIKDTSSEFYDLLLKFMSLNTSVCYNMKLIHVTMKQTTK